MQQLSKSPGGSGSNFCVGYIAERNGQKAFVKALDFVDALAAPDPVAELTKLTSLATFEREAMELCEANKLSRLIRLISHEYVNLDPTNNPMNRVYCLIMEIGAGDLRKQLSHLGVFSCSAVFSILADVALGMSQLHRHGVSHQDVKPSNVISMTDMTVPKDSVFKVGDLGRVVRKDRSGPYDAMAWPGDGQYAPPERWYGHVPSQWTDAREASDAYMLGSLVFFLFTATPLQAIVANRLPPLMHPGTWAGGYNEPLILVLRSLQLNIISDDLVPKVPASLKDSLVAIVKELIEPDPAKRGDKRARAQTGKPVGLERFVPRFRQLATQAGILERVKATP
ncbi:protein kinase domain-containing protein [Roseateles chitinivorans]|uniref:protein kinase domain-containing protein n=1 Tax=Roseateles chitinivorans TaxID=2917965 RepID=UPI003D67FF08